VIQTAVHAVPALQLDINLPIAYLHLISPERSLRRAAYRRTLTVEQALVAGAFESLVLREVKELAIQMRAFRIESYQPGLVVTHDKDLATVGGSLDEGMAVGHF
jgi:hypothetical protein